MNEDFQQFKNETKDSFIKLKGQIDNQDNQIKKLELQLQNAETRLATQRKAKSVYDFLQVYKLHAGLPVYTTTTNLIGFPGQAFLVNASGNTTPRKVVGFQISNTVSVVALT